MCTCFVKKTNKNIIFNNFKKIKIKIIIIMIIIIDLLFCLCVDVIICIYGTFYTKMGLVDFIL